MVNHPRDVEVAVQDTVIRRYLEGQSAIEIADALGLSVLTVRGCLKAVYAELDVGSREQLRFRSTRDPALHA
jgi:DNA-binding CsgD family transcriptional regulator